jgi:hypothetical protein
MDQFPPKPLIIPLGLLKFAEIFTAQDVPPVSLTPLANEKNLQSEFIISFGHIWVVELAHRLIFFFKFILCCQQFDNCSHCLPPVSATLLKLVEKFAAGVIDTCGAP